MNMSVARLGEDFDDSDSDLDADSSIDADQLQILQSAENNVIDKLKWLLEQKPSLVSTTDSDGYTPLHRACYNGHTEVVKILLDSGADLEHATNDGWKPLHCCCRWNNTETALYLIERGACVNAQTNGGQTPLHLAASNKDGRNTVLLLLTNPHIDTSILNNCNETAYQIAYRTEKHYTLFKLLEPSINEI